ncbi:ISAs1 family transposase [Parasphingorhabdus sp.]|uniref:ISAs1 family transposase n=1 Tax=Parasphingorhabdus sp. TaxID=2709688 RepID=UPI0013DC383F
MYPLDEILLLALLGVLAGAERFVDIARFGNKKREFLRRFRPFEAGTPSHDHLGDIFATLDAGKFPRCFMGWVASLTGTSAEVIAVDAKTSPFAPEGRRQSRNPHGLGLCCTRAAGAGPDQGRRKVERDYHHPQITGDDGYRGHRRDSSPIESDCGDRTLRRPIWQ